MQTDDFGTDTASADPGFDGGQDFAADPGPVETGETPDEHNGGGFNPAWGGLREAIGEDFFEAHAKPLLSEMDRNANSRITNLNSQLKSYESFKPFVEQQVNPSDLQQAFEVMQLIKEDPQQFYTFLGQRLGVDVAADAPEEEGDEAGFEAELPAHVQAQLEQLSQWQQQQQQAQEAQAFESQVATESKRLDEEMNAFLSRNPTWTESDLPELRQIQFDLSQRMAAEGIRRVATPDEAAEVLKNRYSAYQRRLGGGAPTPLPTSAGGNISSHGQFDPLTASKQELADQVVRDLLQQRTS